MSEVDKRIGLYWITWCPAGRQFNKVLIINQTKWLLLCAFTVHFRLLRQTNKSNGTCMETRFHSIQMSCHFFFYKEVANYFCWCFNGQGVKTWMLHTTKSNINCLLLQHMWIDSPFSYQMWFELKRGPLSFFQQILYSKQFLNLTT